MKPFLFSPTAGERVCRFLPSKTNCETNILAHQQAEASLKKITDFALATSLQLTDSPIGFLGFMNEDESIFTIHAWSQEAMEECRVMDKPTDFPIARTGIWGEAVRHR